MKRDFLVAPVSEIAANILVRKGTCVLMVGCGSLFEKEKKRTKEMKRESFGLREHERNREMGNGTMR